MRWLWAVGTLFTFVICFTRHSAVALAVWLVISLLAAIFTALVFVQARIEANDRPSPLLDYQMKSHGKRQPSKD